MEQKEGCDFFRKYTARVIIFSRWLECPLSSIEGENKKRLIFQELCDIQQLPGTVGGRLWAVTHSGGEAALLTRISPQGSGGKGG
jgi:hypothetical protein